MNLRIATRIVSTLLLSCTLISCGGGSSGSAPVTIPTPSPNPSPSPTPTPAPAPTPQQVTVSYLHVFQTASVLDGGQPNGPLLQASDGNFYGTTRSGGANRCDGANNLPCGAIIKMTPAGTEAVLYSFGAFATDGYSPQGALIQGRDGALYGTTAFGGTYGAGTVFKIALDGTYTILYSFGAAPSDGAVPTSALVQANDGNFYGTTSSGGANHCIQIPSSGGNCGTVFKMTPSGAVTVLYSFGGSTFDGVQPNGPLIQAVDGNLYGTTSNGGSNDCGGPNGIAYICGTVFRVTLAGQETVLHSFGASTRDGIAPQGPLIQGNDGAFYGTTSAGGGNNCGYYSGCGTVFKMTANGQVSTLYAFSSRADGYGPSPFLIQATDGNFYGTTGSGGANAADLNGTVFVITPAGVKTTLHSFGPLNQSPSNPLAGVIQGSDGAFYGVTTYNGMFGSVGANGGTGTIFKLVVQ